MIAYLSGTVHDKEKQALIVATGGIGYRVFTACKILEKLKVGHACELYTHLYVREDAWELYGFTSHAELEFFRLLLGVNGVGPKSALHIFNIGTVEQISCAIAQGDIAFLTKVSGIGRKTAERMIVELKNKVGVLNEDGDGKRAGGGGAAADVVDALVQMGYSAFDARSAVASVGADKAEKDVGKLLKKALVYLKKSI